MQFCVITGNLQQEIQLEYSKLHHQGVHFTVRQQMIIIMQDK